jgi:hypothetical protein
VNRHAPLRHVSPRHDESHPIWPVDPSRTVDAAPAIDRARLLTLHAASFMDVVDDTTAATEIAAIKVAAPPAARHALDRRHELRRHRDALDAR